MNKVGALIAAAAITGMVATPVAAAGPNRGGNGGDCTGTSAATGSLTVANQKVLADMAEEEKLAHDVYVALAEQYPQVAQFDRIADSEARHLASLKTLMTRYSVTDPTTGMATGEFQSPAVQSLYKELLAQSDDANRALAVGVKIEKMDIADLIEARSTVKKTDVKRVYTNLLQGSRSHLTAFSH